MIQRVLQNTVATVTATFLDQNGDTPTPLPDSANVTVTRDDGTVIATGVEATPLGDGRFSYTLTPSETGTLDILTFEWTNATVGVTLTTVEVVGGFLFSIADARAQTALSSAAEYPTAKIAEYRTLAEQAFEDAAGVAFVPRYGHNTYYSASAVSAHVLSPHLRRIRSAAIGTEILTVTDLADLNVTATGILYRDMGWNGPVDIAYEHGYDTPPGPVSKAVLMLAKTWLINGPIDDRATSFATEDGIVNMSTPGFRGVQFGIPYVDSTLAQYIEHVYVG